MKITAVDSETMRIRPGLQAPPLVCVTHTSNQSYEISQIKRRFSSLDLETYRAKLLDRHQARGFVKDLLGSTDLIVGHNIAFDLSVFAAAWPEFLPDIFKAYEDDRISDTMIREKLGHIARGYKGFEKKDGKWLKIKYSLADVAMRRLKVQLTKGDWQLRFGELIDVPTELWPKAAKDYALTDVETTLLVWEHQQIDHQGYLLDEFRQSRAAWWIQLMSCWGLHTDEAGVREFSRRTQKKYEDIAADLVRAGLLRANGVRDTKAAAARMLKARGDKTEFTEPSKKHPQGQVKLDSDCCERSGDPILIKYSELSSLKKTLSTDIPLLLQGIHTPIQANFDSLLETGRTSSSPNVQNLPRVVGVRECFVPRKGWVFASADYSGFELRTMSQVCVSNGWRSRLAEALNAGNDPHLEVARRILGISYAEAEARIEEDVVDKARQAGKVANFGFPGGLGFTRFVDFARMQYGVEITEKQSRELKDYWLQSWPEFKEYFNWVGKQCDQPFSQIRQLFSDRFRGDVSFTEACNSYFQGLAADAAKHAGFLISRACYVDEASVLYGCRLVNFVHDEFIVEVPDDQYAADAAEELARLMIVGANPFLPDVPPVAKPQLMRRWSKKAKPVRDDNGRLIPWEWKEAA